MDSSPLPTPSEDLFAQTNLNARGHISLPRAWILGSRPRTLPAAMAPVFVGSALAYADGGFALLPALAALIASVLIQVGTNLANDYFDCVKGIDVPDRKGPLRVAQAGLIPLKELRLGIIAVFGTTALLGLYLIWRGGWPILVIGTLSLIAAVGYSGGPYPLSSHGLGDLFAFLFFGLAGVVGTHYVQILQFNPLSIVFAIPIGALTTAILIVNNYRDIETDARVGKRTLAVRIGPKGSRVEYVAMLLLAYGTVTALWVSGAYSAPILFPLLSMPLAVRWALVLFRHTDGPTLNRALAGTAQVDFVFSALFAIGTILA